MSSTRMEKILSSARDGSYSDFIIKCGDIEHKVHKLVICTCCPFFAKACNGPFKEGQTGIVDLVEDDPGAVEAMVEYFYMGYYPKTETGEKTGEKLSSSSGVDYDSEGHKITAKAPLYLELHSKVYTLADKYDIPDLRDMAYYSFRWIASVWKVDEPLSTFALAANWIYSESPDTDRKLRDIVVRSLYTQPGSLQKGPIKEMLRDLPELTFDIVMFHGMDTMSLSGVFEKAALRAGLLTLASGKTAFRDSFKNTKAVQKIEAPSRVKQDDESGESSIETLLGSADPPFSTYSRLNGDGEMEEFQNIGLRDPYTEWSLEEVRLADYAQGNKWEANLTILW